MSAIDRRITEYNKGLIARVELIEEIAAMLLTKEISPKQASKILTRLSVEMRNETA